MHSIDAVVTQWIVSLHGRSQIIDRLFSDLLQFPTFKILPVLLMMVGLWASVDWQSDRRRILVSAVVAGFVTLILTRLIQNLGPNRTRPALSGLYDFRGLYEGPPADWSSFPSDTAGLALAVATGVFLTSRPLGTLALLWAIGVTSFSRLYCGQHYLSDLVAGGLIGSGLTVVLTRSRLSKWIYDKLVHWAAPREYLFYPFAFFVLFEVADWFWDFRRIVTPLAHMLLPHF